MEYVENIIISLNWLLYNIGYYNLLHYKFPILDIGLLNILILHHNNKEVDIHDKINTILDISLEIEYSNYEELLFYFNSINNTDVEILRSYAVDIYDILATIFIKENKYYYQYLLLYNEYRENINNLYLQKDIDNYIENNDFDNLLHCLNYTSLKYICSKFLDNINIEDYNYLLNKLYDLDFTKYYNNTMFAYILTHIIMNDTYHGCLTPRKEMKSLYLKCLKYFKETKDDIKHIDIDLYLEYELCFKIIDNNYKLDYIFILSLQNQDKTNKTIYGSFNLETINKPNKNISLGKFEMEKKIYHFTHLTQICLLLLIFDSGNLNDSVIQFAKEKTNYQ